MAFSNNRLYQFFVILALDCAFGRPLQQPAHLFPTTSGTEKLLKPKISPTEVQLSSSHRHHSSIDLCVLLNWSCQGSMRNFQSGMFDVLSAVPRESGVRKGSLSLC